MNVHIYKTTVRLHHTDAAGDLFFASQFEMAHDSYESMMEALKFPLADIINTSSYALPIVHAEADFKSALRVGDTVEIHVTVKEVGESSFKVNYAVRDSQGKELGRVTTVHVAVRKKKNKSIPLPAELREALITQTD